MQVPTVPIYVKGLSQPMPRAGRCYRLGQMLRRFVERWPGNERVAIVASGSFSLEVGGPRSGWIDSECVSTVAQLIRDGDAKDLARRATALRMLAAGNTGGELLNWIALMGALGDVQPAFLECDGQPPEAPRDAHGYAFWQLD